MAGLEEFCKIDLTMQFEMIGKVPSGTRLDIPFEGTATSSHWDGELPVRGVDYVTIRADGNMDLDLRARIGQGKGMVAYRGTGLSVVPERGIAEPRELLTFETANEDLAFLNTSVGVAVGRGEGPNLSLTVYLVQP
jgi:hypothetical protein